jgi:hypothetical protein
MLLALLVMAQSVTATVPAPGEVVPGLGRPASCATVMVVTPGGAPTRSAFSATRILDLELRAHVRPLPAGPHLLELKLYTPHGHLYQVLPVAFEGAGAASAGDAAAPQAPWQAAYRGLPLQAAPLVRAQRAVRHRVVATLPVAGTSIVAASLFGRWRVDAHLDGAVDSCGTPAFFRLAP